MAPESPKGVTLSWSFRTVLNCRAWPLTSPWKEKTKKPSLWGSVKCLSITVCPCVCFQPERIDPSASRQGYDVRSDVWSLGITLVRQIMSSVSKWNLTFCYVWVSWNHRSYNNPVCQSVTGPWFVFAFSMSWPQEGFPTPSGTVFLISWHKWWKESLLSSATRRRGSSPQSSSTLLTYGKPCYRNHC